MVAKTLPAADEIQLAFGTGTSLVSEESLPFLFQALIHAPSEISEDIFERFVILIYD